MYEPGLPGVRHSDYCPYSDDPGTFPGSASDEEIRGEALSCGGRCFDQSRSPGVRGRRDRHRGTFAPSWLLGSGRWTKDGDPPARPRGAIGSQVAPFKRRISGFREPDPCAWSNPGAGTGRSGGDRGEEDLAPAQGAGVCRRLRTKPRPLLFELGEIGLRNEEFGSMPRAMLVSRGTARSRTDNSSRTRSARVATPGELSGPAVTVAAPAKAPVGGREPLGLTCRQVCDEIVRSLARRGCRWG
jgi:hypothetical protein